MTEKLYLVDSYLKEVDSWIDRIDGNEIILNRTIFYPAGGGQPNDTGILTINGEKYGVVDLKKGGDDVIHILDKPAQAKVRDTTHCAIDWDKRYACMRYHSALHLIDGVIEKFYGGGMVTGGQIYPDRARIDIDMPDLSKEKVVEILEKTNSVAGEGHAITAREISIEEATKIPRLSRTETGRKLLEILKTVRVVDISGVDVQADGGTHVKNTSEIGTVTLNGYENKGAKRKRIEILLK